MIEENKRFLIFERNNDEYVIDMEYALGYDDPNVDFIEFLGNALTTKDMVNELNKQNYKIDELQIINHELQHEVSLLCEFFRLNGFTLDDFNNFLIKKGEK